MCAFEFNFVAGVVSASVLHLFAFGMLWPGVLFVVCLRMGCVCFLRVLRVQWIPPECRPGNACVMCVLVRSVYVWRRGNGSGTCVRVRRVRGVYVWECLGVWCAPPGAVWVRVNAKCAGNACVGACLERM